MLPKKCSTFLIFCQDNQSLALVALALFKDTSGETGSFILPSGAYRILCCHISVGCSGSVCVSMFVCLYV